MENKKITTVMACMNCKKPIAIDMLLKKQIVKCESCGNYHEIGYTKNTRSVKNLERNLRTGYQEIIANAITEKINQ